MRVEELVGQRITKLRDRAGMTQAHLGELLGELLGRPWPRQTVSIAEKGERKLNAAELYAIALVLGVHVGQLFVPPARLDGIEFPGGATVEGGRLHGQGPFTTEPLAPEALAPAVALKMREIVTDFERRIGRDRATVHDLTQFHERLVNSMAGGDVLAAQEGEH